MNILIACLITIILFALGYFAYKLRRFEQAFASFVTAPDEKTPSLFASTVDNISRTVGHGVAIELKTTFMGIQSGAKRAEQAVMNDIVQDTVQEASPLAGAVLESFPSLKKTIAKNPALLDVLLSRVMGGMASKTNNGGANGGDYSNRLAKYS